MRGLDFITTAAALGVFGYFVYKVILPKLGDLKLPSFQPIQPPPQQPAAPAQPPPVTPPAADKPAPAVTMPDKVPLPTSILPDPEKPKIEKQPATKSTKTQPSPQIPTTPPASQPSAGGALLYDSNTHGKWNNGQKRVVPKSEGGQGPNGKGFATAASGDPTLTIDGNGVAHLTSSKFGRIYIYANNYNTRLEGNLMFETINAPGDNISLKLRSRHGHNNTYPLGGGSECGGIGGAYHADGSIDMKAEQQHPDHTPMGGGTGPKPQIGKWYKFAFSVWDAGGTINSRFDLDGKTVANGKWPSPAAQCKSKAEFDKESYFWIRLNSFDEKTPIKAAFSNIRLTSLSAGANTATARRLMIDEPYLFNGFHNRRRQ